MIGRLKILELGGQKPKRRWAIASALREFHNVVLRAGSVPLQVLETQVDGYVNAALRL